MAADEVREIVDSSRRRQLVNTTPSLEIGQGLSASGSSSITTPTPATAVSPPLLASQMIPSVTNPVFLRAGILGTNWSPQFGGARESAPICPFEDDLSEYINARYKGTRLMQPEKKKQRKKPQELAVDQYRTTVVAPRPVSQGQQLQQVVPPFVSVDLRTITQQSLPSSSPYEDQPVAVLPTRPSAGSSINVMPDSTPIQVDPPVDRHPSIKPGDTGCSVSPPGPGPFCPGRETDCEDKNVDARRKRKTQLRKLKKEKRKEKRKALRAAANDSDADRSHHACGSLTSSSSSDDCHPPKQPPLTPETNPQTKSTTRQRVVALTPFPPGLVLNFQVEPHQVVVVLPDGVVPPPPEQPVVIVETMDQVPPPPPVVELVGCCPQPPEQLVIVQSQQERRANLGLVPSSIHTSMMLSPAQRQSSEETLLLEYGANVTLFVPTTQAAAPALQPLSVNWASPDLRLVQCRDEALVALTSQFPGVLLKFDPTRQKFPFTLAPPASLVGDQHIVVQVMEPQQGLVSLVLPPIPFYVSVPPGSNVLVDA